MAASKKFRVTPIKGKPNWCVPGTYLKKYRGKCVCATHGRGVKTVPCTKDWPRRCIPGTNYWHLKLDKCLCTTNAIGDKPIPASNCLPAGKKKPPSSGHGGAKVKRLERSGTIAQLRRRKR